MEKINNFRELVLNGNFREAYELAKNMKRKQIVDELIAISFETKNILAYGFVVYALLNDETPKYHWIARALLTTSYIDIDGAAELSFCHAKRSYEIDESSFDSLSGIMGMAEHPDTSGTKEDYEFAKQKIEKFYPGDGILNGEYRIGLKTSDIENSKIKEWDND